MTDAGKEVARIKQLRQAVDLLHESLSVDSDRERESYEHQALILIAQVFDGLMDVEHFVALAEARIRHIRSRPQRPG